MGRAFLEDPGVDEFMGFDLTSLGVDEAYLRVTSNYPKELGFYTLNGDCYGCPLEYRTNISAGKEYNLTMNTKHSWTLVLSDNFANFIPVDEEVLCQASGVRMGEFGVYDISLGEHSNSCSFNTLKDPVFEYGALVIAAGVYAGIALLCALLSVAYKKGLVEKFTSCRRNSESQVTLQMSESTGTNSTPVKPSAKPRLKSLDTFRGISIVIMIFVNYGAGQYWFLEHATWNGLQVADLVFPWFLWIMGVCIPMGLRSALRRGTPRSKILYRIVKRSIKLFLLGIVLNSLGGWIYLDKYRIMGVLQRFAISYLVVSVVALLFTSADPPVYESKAGVAMSDMLQILPQWAVHLIIVIGHTAITFLLPVPGGCPTGYLGPGGIALLRDGEGSPGCIGGAAGEVDRILLTSQHLYQNPTAKHVYHSGAFDPEGVLGCMTSVFQVFLGLQAGIILQTHKSHKSRLLRWFTWSAILGAIGAALCEASMNDGVIPLNKNLWSLSFVLVTSCFAYFLLAVCYLLVDVWGRWTGAPFFQAGMNSIFLYVGHSVAFNLFPWHYTFGTMNTHLEMLAETLWGTTLWILIALYLHYKKKFYTV
ncbi:hypothetical protein SK128_009657 [Halocaridina rubra]|uniref:Heparan-alpha-glucosaminide N-acetyltransferase catalytic domain-containing protein n=1 Tax=Halocaridina rubra TaxID=373956 RepID=A0AAN8XIA7_HALRR